MPCFGDVPVGAHFESMNRVWTKLDDRHAQDESGETQLFWDIAPVEPAKSLVNPVPDKPVEPAPEPVVAPEPVEPAPVEPQREEVQAEVASNEEGKPEEGQAEVAPAAEATEEKVDLVVKSKGRRNS